MSSQPQYESPLPPGFGESDSRSAREFLDEDAELPPPVVPTSAVPRKKRKLARSHRPLRSWRLQPFVLRRIAFLRTTLIELDSVDGLVSFGCTTLAFVILIATNRANGFGLVLPLIAQMVPMLFVAFLLLVLFGIIQQAHYSADNLPIPGAIDLKKRRRALFVIVGVTVVMVLTVAAVAVGRSDALPALLLDVSLVLILPGFLTKGKESQIMQREYDRAQEELTLLSDEIDRRDQDSLQRERQSQMMHAEAEAVLAAAKDNSTAVQIASAALEAATGNLNGLVKEQAEKVLKPHKEAETRRADARIQAEKERMEAREREIMGGVRQLQEQLEQAEQELARVRRDPASGRQHV